jgi:hypothetical protein
MSQKIRTTVEAIRSEIMALYCNFQITHHILSPSSKTQDLSPIHNLIHQHARPRHRCHRKHGPETSHQFDDSRPPDPWTRKIGFQTASRNSGFPGKLRRVLQLRRHSSSKQSLLRRQRSHLCIRNGPTHPTRRPTPPTPRRRARGHQHLRRPKLETRLERAGARATRGVRRLRVFPTPREDDLRHPSDLRLHWSLRRNTLANGRPWPCWPGYATLLEPGGQDYEPLENGPSHLALDDRARRSRVHRGGSAAQGCGSWRILECVLRSKHPHRHCESVRKGAWGDSAVEVVQYCQGIESESAQVESRRKSERVLALHWNLTYTSVSAAEVHTTLNSIASQYIGGDACG